MEAYVYGANYKKDYLKVSSVLGLRKASSDKKVGDLEAKIDLVTKAVKKMLELQDVLENSKIVLRPHYDQMIDEEIHFSYILHILTEFFCIPSYLFDCKSESRGI